MTSAAPFSRSARTHRTITGAVALDAGLQLQDLTESELLGQYVPLGATLLWAPCASLVRALEPAATLIPEFQHAVACFASSNGSFLAVHLLNESILVINIPSMLADIATAPPGVFTKLEANKKRHWCRVLELPSHLAATIKCIHVSDCGTHVCVITQFNAIYLFSPTFQGQDLRNCDWRQLPCPSAIPHAPIATHVTFHSQHIQTVYLSCSADRSSSETDGEQAARLGSLSLQILSVSIHLHTFTSEMVFFHEYQVDQDQPPASGVLHPAVCSSVPPTRLLGNVPIQFTLSRDSSNTLAVHIQQSSRSNRKRAAAEGAASHASLSSSSSTPQTDWIVLLHNWTSPHASHGILVSTRRLYEQHPSSANDSTPLVTPNESEGDVVAAASWVPVPNKCILAVLSCSGKLAWITPAGRISRLPLTVPEINAAWQLGDQDLLALSKLTLRRLNPHESLIAGTPVLQPRLFNQAAQPAQQARAQISYSLCAAVARVPSGADGLVRVDPVLLVSDGRIVVSVQVPFDLTADDGGKGLKSDAFKSVTHAIPSLGTPRRGSSQHLNQQVTASNQLRTFLDAVLLEQCPWVMDPLAPEEEDEAVSGNMTSYQLDISPVWAKDALFGAVVKRLIDSIIALAEDLESINTSDSAKTRPAARGFVRRGITQALSSTRKSPNLDILFDALHLILGATSTRHHSITGIGIAGRMVVQLVERGHPECAVQVVHFVCNWLTGDNSARNVQTWTMGWRVMEEALLKCDGSDAHAVITECVRMFAPSCVASQLAGNASGFDRMRTDGIPMEVVQFVDQEPEIQFAEGANGLQSSLRYALANGRWDTALDIFCQSCEFEPYYAGDADTLEHLQLEWVQFATQVVNAFSAAEPSVATKTVLISSPIDPERKQHADLASLTSYTNASSSHFDPHQVFVQVAGTRNPQVLDFLVRHVSQQVGTADLGHWNPAWPNLLLFSLVSASRSSSPDQAYLRAASLVDDLLSWALSSEQVHAARFIAQMTTSLAHPTLGGCDNSLTAIGGVHQYYLRSTLAHIKQKIQVSLPLRIQGLAASSPTHAPSDGSWDALTYYPSVGHLLQQTIFEGDSEKWPEEVSVTLVPLIRWIKCALQLAAAVASAESLAASASHIPLLPIFKVLRVCYALELRAEILKALAQHAGDNQIKSIAKTSVAWMEKVLLLLHFDDVFGEAAVVRFAATVLRESVSGVKSASNLRQAQEAVSAVVLTLDQLVTPRIASMAILAACSPVTDSLSKFEHQRRGESAKHKDEWSFWPSEIPFDPQTPLTPAAFAHLPDFLPNAGANDPTQSGTTARVTTLLNDIRFRRFCETLLPVIEEHVLQPPPPAAARSLYDKATFYWQPCFPPLVPKQALAWALNEDEEDDEPMVRPPTRGDHAASCELGEFDSPSPTAEAEYGTDEQQLQVEDFDADPVAEFHGMDGAFAAPQQDVPGVGDIEVDDVDPLTDTSELFPIREDRLPRPERVGGNVTNPTERRDQSPKRRKKKKKSKMGNTDNESGGQVAQEEAYPSFITARDANDNDQNLQQQSEPESNNPQPIPINSTQSVQPEADKQTKELIVTLSTAMGTLVSELHGFVVAMNESQKANQEPASAPPAPPAESLPIPAKSSKPAKERKKKRRKPESDQPGPTTYPESKSATIKGMKKSPSFELFVRERTLAEGRKFRTIPSHERDKHLHVSPSGTFKFRHSPAKLYHTETYGSPRPPKHIEGKLLALHRPTVKLTSTLLMR